MTRRRDEMSTADLSVWPTVDFNALPTKARKTFATRRQAIELYAAGKTVRDIENHTGINSKQLYRLIDRCLAQAEDGKILGFRGLLKYKHIQSYTRAAKLSPACPVTGQGLAGAFRQLLERYPALTEWLQLKIRKRAVNLKQIGGDGATRTKLHGLGNLHNGFIQQCRSVGLTAADYPLNTDRAGIRSLSAYVTAEMLRNFGAAAHAAGALHLIRNVKDVATCLAGYGDTNFPRDTEWSFTRFYVPQAVDAGYRLIDDAQTLWAAFEQVHNKAGFANALEIPMESFTRAVEIVLKDSEVLDAPKYRPSADLWVHAVRNSGYVQARMATSRIVSELAEVA